MSSDTETETESEATENELDVKPLTGATVTSSATSQSQRVTVVSPTLSTCTSSSSDDSYNSEEERRRIEEGRKRRMADLERPQRYTKRVKKGDADEGPGSPTLSLSSQNESQTQSELGGRSKRKSKTVDTSTDEETENETPRPRKRFKRKQKVTRQPPPPSQSQSKSQRRKKQPVASSSSSQQFAFSQEAQGSSIPGIIKSIQLRNFMCHSNFIHHFHPNLNFITGQNGSGKSALLSGILVALGGKASVTSRTNSLKSLIQKGKNAFHVAVTLDNRNGSPRYGHELTIERSVNQSGTGGYKIKTVGGDYEDDRWRPIKRHELETILLTLNIQIDNPVAILNQEVARSFLRSKDPKTKFNLFYDGTLLSKLESILEETEADLDLTKASLKQHKIAMHTIKNECLELSRKVEKIEELNQLRHKCDAIHHEYLWAIVNEAEKEKDKNETEVARNLKEVEVIAAKEQEVKDALKNLSEDSIQAEQEAVRKLCNEKKTVFNGLKSDLMKKKAAFTECKQKIKTVVMTIAKKEADIAKLSSQIEKLKAEADAQAQNEAHEDEEKLKELQNQKKHFESVSVSLKEDADNFQQAAEGANERLQEIQNQARAIHNQIEMKKKSMANLGSNSNKYAVFGKKMQDLMVKVQGNMRRFRKPPRGPLGACFRVKDPQFVVLVEGILKNILDSFVVDNGHDLNLMKELIGGVYGKTGKIPGIIMTPFADGPFDISRNHASVPRVPTLYDMIEVENNDFIVMNTLVDVCEVERQLLFKTNEAACEILKEESKCPASLKNGYSLQWYRFIPAPKFAARVMKKLNEAQILKGGRNKEAMKKELQTEIEGLKEDLNSLAPEKGKVQSEVSSHQALFDQKMNEYQKVRRQLGETVNEIKRHMAKIKQRQHRFDFNSYYEELDELKEDLEKQKVDRENFTKEMEELRPSLVEMDNLRQELTREIEELSTQLAGFTEAREKLQSRKAELENIIKKVQVKLSRLRSIKSELEENLRKSEARVEETIQRALNSTLFRIETNKSSSALRKEFDTLKIHVQETESHLGDEEELRQKLVSIRKKYKGMLNEFTPIDTMYKLLRKILEDQQESFEKMKKHMGRTLTLFFSAMAKQRGYEGRLIVEFNTRELYYFVCPDGDSMSKTIKAIDSQSQRSSQDILNESQAKQNKMLKKTLVEYSLGLSGGERSFSTICFILALWQVMECPFYMLDEFDVFMDAFNRKTSQQALMCHAKKFNMHQFVLFTPLDLDQLPGPDEATVLRLFPPKRSGCTQTATSGEGASSQPQQQRPGRSNRNSDDCVENINPLSSSQPQTQQKKGNGKRKK